MKRYVLRTLILSVALTLVACAQSRGELPVVGTLERDRIELIAEAREPIMRVAVREGDTVSTGETLVVLDDRRQRAVLAQARAAAEGARQRLAELARGPRDETIAETRARLARAEAQLRIRRQDFARARSLIARRAVSQADFDRARAQRDAAHSTRKAIEARLAALLEGARAEKLAQARARLAEMMAALRTLEITVQRLTVRAPRDGVVDALPYHVGERPPPGGTVAVLLASGPPYARVYIPAPLRAGMQSGMAAKIRVEGAPSVFSGRLRFVSSEAAFTPYFALTERDRSRLSYLAEIDLTGRDARKLPVGVPVTAGFGALQPKSPH